MAQAGLWEPDSSWPALKIIRIVASGGIRRPYGVVWLDVPGEIRRHWYASEDALPGRRSWPAGELDGAYVLLHRV